MCRPWIGWFPPLFIVCVLPLQWVWPAPLWYIVFERQFDELGQFTHRNHTTHSGYTDNVHGNYPLIFQQIPICAWSALGDPCITELVTPTLAISSFRRQLIQKCGAPWMLDNLFIWRSRLVYNVKMVVFAVWIGHAVPFGCFSRTGIYVPYAHTHTDTHAACSIHPVYKLNILWIVKNK